MSAKLPMLLGALLLSTSLAQAPASQSPAVSPERELLERVVGSELGSPLTRTTVLVRQVPADLGFALPPNSRVVGSVITTSKNPDFPGGASVYFDTRLSPAEVSSYFARVLGRAGWKVFPQGPGGPSLSGGFLPSEPVGNQTYYRQKPDQRLMISARAVGNVTQVWLVRYNETNLSQQLLAAAQGSEAMFSQLPKLRAPEGSVVSPRGGGSSGDNVTQNANIESKLSRKALFDHYAAQLRQAGWTLQNRADTGTLTTSIWTFKQNGKERVGLLLIGEVGKGQYRAVIGVQGLE